jgi:hypothetical protein
MAASTATRTSLASRASAGTDLSASTVRERGPRRWVWIALAALSLVGFAAFDVWLLTTRGAISAELLFWEAQRRLVEGADPPRLSLLLTSDQPLVLYLAALGGSAIAAAAIAGMASVLVLVHGWWRTCAGAGRGVAWLLPMTLTLAHPAIWLTAAQYPQPALRALLVLSAGTWLLRYAEDGATYALLVAAASLAGLGLLEPAPWVLWLYLALALILSSRRPRAEQTARVLMLLFPAVFLAVGRAILSGQVGGGLGPAQAHLAACQTTGADALRASVDPNCLVAGGVAGFGAVFSDLWFFAPAAVLLGLWAAGRVVVSRRSGRAGLTMLLLLFLLEPLARPWLALDAAAARPLDVMLPLLALPLLASYAWARPGGWVGWLSTSVLLLVGLVLAWVNLLVAPLGDGVHAQAEDAALLRAAVSEAQPLAWLAPYREAAGELNGRLRPGERVLLDDAQLYPVVALVAAPGALLLPHDATYGVASQCPDGLAAFVVVSVPEGPPGDAELLQAWATRLSDYDLVANHGRVRVYQLARPGATARCLGLAR